jgi:hypothetical protein|tara:strand:- start:6758 stop:7192 length:435 start_codon:yes stop_codon:yes gene_type:complete
MKMKDLNEKYGDDDFGIRDVGRELDNDDAGMSDRNYTDPPANQLKKILNIGSQQTIKTVDGTDVEMSDQQATLLLGMVDSSKPGSIARMFKPDAVDRMGAVIMDSGKLQKLLSIKGPDEMKNAMANMANLSSVDKRPDGGRSNY